MDLIRDIEDTDDELIIRGEQGSGPVLFYTGLTGIVAGVGFAIFDAILGQTVVILSAVVVIVGYLLAQRQTTLEVDHSEGIVTTGNSQWSLNDVVAVVLSPWRRVPGHIDDPSLVTEETGTRLWRARLIAHSEVRERNKLMARLEALGDEASGLHVLELDARLEELGGEIFMQMPTPENPTEAAARAARHLDVPLFEFAQGAAPRRLEAGDVPVDELREAANERHGLR